jgi:hypothetical protein
MVAGAESGSWRPNLVRSALGAARPVADPTVGTSLGGKLFMNRRHESSASVPLPARRSTPRCSILVNARALRWAGVISSPAVKERPLPVPLGGDHRSDHRLLRGRRSRAFCAVVGCQRDPDRRTARRCPPVRLRWHQHHAQRRHGRREPVREEVSLLGVDLVGAPSRHEPVQFAGRFSSEHLPSVVPGGLTWINAWTFAVRQEGWSATG